MSGNVTGPATGLPMPPDGARLASLDERQVWLSKPQVVYALPEIGLLSAGFDEETMVSTMVSTDGVTLHVRVGASERAVALTPESLGSLRIIWNDLWREPAGPSPRPELFLHARGLFRTIASSEAWDHWLHSTLSA